MKKSFIQFASLMFFSLFITSFINAQTCNDPNAYNSGEEGACQTCFDFIQNGDETGVDCGGSYPGCPECPLSVLSSVEGNNDNEYIYSRVSNLGEGGAGLWLFSEDNTEGSTKVLFRNAEGENPRYWAIGNDGTDDNKFKIFPSSTLEGTTSGITIDRFLNFGIGTNTPDSELHVVGRTHCDLTGIDARVLTLGIERSWDFMQYSSGANTALRLFSNSLNKDFLISTDGNVSIGTINND